MNLFENNFIKEINIDNNLFCFSEKKEYEKYLEPNLTKLYLNIFNIINSQPSPKVLFLNIRMSELLMYY